MPRRNVGMNEKLYEGPVKGAVGTFRFYYSTRREPNSRVRGMVYKVRLIEESGNHTIEEGEPLNPEWYANVRYEVVQRANQKVLEQMHREGMERAIELAEIIGMPAGRSA